jgi:signal peptidase I
VTRGLPGFVRDNLEAFAVAIALALVVRHYCLEAFRIPTNSMMPTLLGDDSHPRQGGDRILVDKAAYLRRDPRRFETVVFQYPLNRGRNFIKRLVGLPGEWLRIDDGDIWTSRDEGATWRIERKPRGVQETLFFPFYPAPVESPAYFSAGGNWQCGSGWRADERGGRFDVDARESARMRFLAALVPYSSDGIWGDVRADDPKGGTGDARVSFRLAVEREGTLAIVLTEHGLEHRLVLAPDGSHAVITRPGGRAHRLPLDARVRAASTIDVSFANVDDTLLIDIDGEEKTIEFPEPATAPYDPQLFGTGVFGRHGIALEAESIKATITQLRIDRDLHYADDGEWRIPRDNYFMLGDNTSRSKDSRKWKVAKAHLKNGDVVAWETESDVPGQPSANFAEGGDDAVILVRADVDGLVRPIRNGDVERFERNVAAPFVSRDHLVGRAFAIFWPIHLWPAYRGPTRVGLIR